MIGRLGDRIAAAAARAPWREALLILAICGLLGIGGTAALQRKDASKDDTIRIVAGELPPQMTSTGAGREAEIVTAALRTAYPDRKIAFHVVPFTRHWEAFERESRHDKRYDAVLTVPARLTLDGFPSANYIQYQNGIIYRKADFPAGLGASPLAKLRGRRVVGFAGAAGLLPEISNNIPRYQSYAEYDDQYIHSAMLARGSVDAVIADRLIVDAYNRRIMGARYRLLSSRLAFDIAFCPTPYHAVFKTDRMRDAFDKGLAALRANGALARINARYADRPAMEERRRPRMECPE